MSPRYIVFVGTSVAPSQHSPSHAWKATNEFGSIVTTCSPGSHAEAPVGVGPAEVRVVQLAAGLRVPVDVLHGDRVGLVASELRQQVRQHELPVEHRCPPE